MTPKPTTTAVWTGLVRASARIQARVEAALQAAELPPLGWYDVLWEIEKAGKVRPLVLLDRLLLPQYGLSRLVDRMVKAGLVARQSCDADGRGQMLSLTEQGREARARMWPIYAGVLVAEVEDRLDPDLALAMARGLAGLSAPDAGK